MRKRLRSAPGLVVEHRLVGDSPVVAVAGEIDLATGEQFREAIDRALDGIPGPINVIPGFRGAPGPARLRDLGVRRISFAGRLYHAAQTEHQRHLAAIRAGDEF